jgi:hypothetical protein
MYPNDGRRLSTPFTPPQSPSLSSSPFDPVTKATLWMGDQYVPTSPKPTGLASSTKKPASQEASLLSSPPSTPESKKVHWSPDVQDNQGKTPRKSQERSYQPASVPKSATFQPKVQVWYPAVPESPASRRPPPAPRPRRLPTPDLDDLDHGPFCTCCPKDTTSKMSAQRKTSLAIVARQY